LKIKKEYWNQYSFFVRGIIKPYFQAMVMGQQSIKCRISLTEQSGQKKKGCNAALPIY
jgi:hypothetical protein